MKIVTTILLMSILSATFAFEGVIHGVKMTNGTKEEFDIYMRGDLIAVEGEDGQGKYRIIIDRTKEEIFVCIDNPFFGQKGYFHYTAEQLKREKKIKVLSTKELNDTEVINGQTCRGYSLVSNGSTVLMYADEVKEVDLTGLSKYMDDPVYELIDAFNVKKAIRKITVNKGENTYSVILEEESKSVDDSRFQVPIGYQEYEININVK
ncbi:hypothetical protein [Parvicella tangerina]|uniref:DUF4412 domain-containing protein n=1 Tax=Parvicella tangerina TaxID=2829795 RepID=A0A916JMI5_9FLAO|nr:hypothetical protein [Parvicella tangerina]CAG5080881.1 hypothetical protein CRYO30217_01469 [Parvicella tangerina]